MSGILGKKIGMTRIINQEDGRVTPVTVIQCTPNAVVQVKTVEKDGYSALVLGFDPIHKPSKNKKFHHMKEFRVQDENAYQIGATVAVDTFEVGEEIILTATSKGRGFAGVIKRHNFSRGPETHGSHHHREPGSIGSSARPSRVHKGKKMPGRMGSDQITLSRIQVVYVDTTKNLIAVKGSVAGANGGLVVLRKKI